MTTSQKTRDELSRLYRDERDDLRCELKSKLYKQAKELTLKIDWDISQLNASIETLRDQRKQLLQDNKLLGLVDNPRGSCVIENTHPEIIKFDSETVKGRRKILNQK